MEIKDKIASMRNAKGLSQAKFARGLDCTQQYIHNLEKGEKIPSPKFIRDMLVQLKVNQVWWETGEGEMFESESEKAEAPLIVRAILGKVESLSEADQAEAFRILAERFPDEQTKGKR